MEWNPVFQTLYREFEVKLFDIEKGDGDIFHKAKQAIGFVSEAINELRDIFMDTPLDEEEEILFFREVKPSFCSRLIYYFKLNHIEGRRAPVSRASQKSYIKRELRRIDHYYSVHADFYEYCRSGATYLDKVYFIRRKQDWQAWTDLLPIHSDLNFTTGYDYILAKLQAGKLLVHYLTGIMHQVEGNDWDRGSIPGRQNNTDKISTPLKGTEIYILLKSLVDSQAVIGQTYKSFFGLTVPHISNLHTSFSVSSLLKYSDKVDMESRENVKRLLQKMIRNVDSY